MEAIRKKHDEICIDSRSNGVSHTHGLYSYRGLSGNRNHHNPWWLKSVYQTCDDGIMKPFKTSFTALCQQWKVSEYAWLGGTGKIPTPGRAEVLQ